MSTLEGCIAAGQLARIGGNLRRHQQPNRLLVGGVGVLNDMIQRLPGMKTDDYFMGSVRPLEQAAVLFNQFVAGEDFLPPFPHEMRPLGNGVWRLRTADLRFAGWFPKRNFFVIGAFDSKAGTLRTGRNDEMHAEVMALRAETALFDGSFEASEDYHELIRL